LREEAPEVSDPGLQPERTVIAWSRTMISFLVASAVFLRWLPHYGLGMILLLSLSSAVAFGILFSQRARYRKMLQGVRAERLRADVVAVVLTSLMIMAMGVCAIIMVIEDV